MIYSPDSLVAFVWAVHPTGYQITLQNRVADQRPPTPAQPTRFLSPVSSSPGALRLYAPLVDHPALFKTFAHTPQTPDDVLQFANLYGPLGIAEMVYSVAGTRSQIPAQVAQRFNMPRSDPQKPTMVTRRRGDKGESLDAWFSEIGDLADVMSIWDAVQSDNRRLLAQRIEWSHDDQIIFRSSRSGSEVIVGPQRHPQVLDRISRQDLTLPARLAVQQKVNQKLEEQRVSANLLWDQAWSQLELRLVPVSLLGCLWLQFARAIAGNKAYRACEQCKHWFEIGGGEGSRSDKRFCSGTCKALANAKKRTKALKLSRSGMKPKEIAEQLDSSLATVQRWIGA
jgi:hypothetical protein